MAPTLSGCGLRGGVRLKGCGSSDCRGRELADPVEVRSADGLVDSDVALEPTDVLALFGLDQRYDHAVLAGSGSAAGAVHIGLVVLGRVVVDHGGDAVHVDSPGRHVGGHQCVDPTAHEVGQGTGALALAASTVDGRRPDLVSAQLLGEAVGAVAGAAEDDGGPGGADRLCCQLDPFVAVDGPEQVRGRRDVRDLVTDLVSDRVRLVVPGELGDVAIQGGREQHRLALVGGLVQESSYGRHEAHVSHAVGLVKDHLAYGVELQGSLVEEVLQASGTGHEDVDTLAKGLELRAVPDAPVDHADAYLSGEGPEFGTDLLGELPGGGQYECPGPTGLGPLHGGHQRNAEGEGLT